MRDPNYAPLYTIERQPRDRSNRARRNSVIAIVVSLAALAVAVAWVLS